MILFRYGQGRPYYGQSLSAKLTLGPCLLPFRLSWTGDVDEACRGAGDPASKKSDLRVWARCCCGPQVSFSLPRGEAKAPVTSVDEPPRRLPGTPRVRLMFASLFIAAVAVRLAAADTSALLRL